MKNATKYDEALSFGEIGLTCVEEQRSYSFGANFVLDEEFPTPLL